MADVPGSGDKAVRLQRPCRSPGRAAELRLIPWPSPNLVTPRVSRHRHGDL